MSTVALTIDYSNGTQKHFTGIPWKKGMTILEAIQGSEAIAPKSSVTFGSDRSGHVLGLVIDGIPSKDAPASQWVIWVNANSFDDRLGTPTSFGLHPGERAANLVDAGDHVLIKLAAVSEKSE
jgi:hypothetical protein